MLEGMKMKETCTLAKEHLERAANKIELELSKDKGSDEQHIAAVVLLMQEIMLAYRKAFGEQCKLEVLSKKEREVCVFKLRFAGDEYDPCADEGATDLQRLLKYGQDIPEWSYEDGWNVIQISVPRMSSTMSVLRFCLGYAQDDKARLYGAFAVQLVGTGFNFAVSFLVARLIVHYTESAIEQAKTALQGTDIEAIKQATEAMQNAGYKLAEIVYSQNGAEGAGGFDPAAAAAAAAAGAQGAAPADDGTIEADYEVVDPNEPNA